MHFASTYPSLCINTIIMVLVVVIVIIINMIIIIIVGRYASSDLDATFTQ